MFKNPNKLHEPLRRVQFVRIFKHHEGLQLGQNANKFCINAPQLAQNMLAKTKDG